MADLSCLPYPLPNVRAEDVQTLTFERTRESQLLRWGPPVPPGREVWAYSDGDDEPHYVRDCTEEEIAAREADYAQAMEKWRSTQGMVRTHGPVVDRCEVGFISGNHLRFIGNGEEWVLVESWHER